MWRIFRNWLGLKFAAPTYC